MEGEVLEAWTTYLRNHRREITTQELPDREATFLAGWQAARVFRNRSSRVHRKSEEAA